MADETVGGAERSGGPSLTEAVRRSPIVVIVLLLVGLLVGALVTLLRGQTYTADAQLMVGTSSDVAVYNSSQALQPQARSQAAAVAMRTETVTDAASKLLDGKVSGRVIRRDTVVAPVTDSAVVTVSATTADADRSAAIANALAKAYDDQSAQQAEGSGDRAQKVIAAQRESLGKEVDSVQAAQAKRYAAVAKQFAGEDTELKQRLTRLALSTDVEFQGYSRRLDNLSDTMTTLRSSQAQSQVDTQLLTAGTNTVFPAEPPSSKTTSTLVRNILIGGVLGLLLGIVLAWRRVDRRERLGLPTSRRRRRGGDAAETGEPATGPLAEPGSS